MELKDLKVEYASVNVSNANAVDSNYRVTASFNTRAGKVTSVNGGTVSEKESGNQIANFNINYEYQNSVGYTFIGDINQQTKSEIIALIDEFVAIALNKAVNETLD